MIISFGWTTPALLAGEKTETRREWNRVYLLQMQAAWRKGQRVHDAWNTTPRNIRHEPRPGKIARIELTALTPMQLWTHWLEADPHLVVVRFKLLELTPYGRELRALQALKVPA
jgi:hypothetical protein